MRIRVILRIFTLLFLLSTLPAMAAEHDPASAIADGGKSYIIQPLDMVSIMVWPYSELSLKAQVRPDGRISYPMLGEIRVSGLSAGQFGKIVRESLEEYVKNPRVAVNIENFRTERVFVLGAVNNPGLVEIRNGDTIFDVISKAGGFTKEAKKSKVGLIKAPESRVEYPFRMNRKGPAKTGKEKGIPSMEAGELIILNVAEVLGKAAFPDNISVADGDIIYVPKGKKVDWNNVYAGVTSLYRLFRLDDVIGD